MKKFTIKIGLLVLLFIASTSFAIASSGQSTLRSLAPNSLFERFMMDLDKITSAYSENYNSVIVYDEADNPISVTSIESKGQYLESKVNDKFYDGNINSIHEYADMTSTGTYQLNVIAKDNNIYITFPAATNPFIKNKWIKVPFEKYEELGKTLGMNLIFDYSLFEATTAEDDKFIELSLSLAKKYNLYQSFPYAIDDGIKVNNATRYNLVFNSDAIAPYYSELIKLGDPKLVKEYILLPGFEQNLSDSNYINNMADNSYISLWFDNKTLLPVRMLNVTSLPTTGIFGKRTTEIIKNITLTKQNKAVNIKAPVSFISFDEALKVLGINLTTAQPGQPSNPKLDNLNKLINDYNNASKKDRAYASYVVAQAYEELEDSINAANYYKLAASHVKKGSADYYFALANAEWALGNGAMANEEFKRAIKKDKKAEVILHDYGYFLLGITKSTAAYQNLTLALELNKRLTSIIVDDDTLMNLYLNYVLIGDLVKADETKTKFDNFGTADNYNLVARAYHRLGNKNMEAYYSKLAKDAGYILNQNDKDFFAMVF